MNQIKFYKLSAWGLLFLNLFVLAFFVLTKPKHRSPHGHPNINFQKEVIITLGLNQQQELAFKELAEAHSEEISSANEQQQELLLPYFESIVDTSSNIDNEVILTQFQQLEREKLEVTNQHLIDVKNLLDEKQLPHFKIFIENFTKKIIRGKKNSPPPKDFK